MSARKRSNRSTKNNSKLLERELRMLEQQLKRSSQPPKWLAALPIHRIVRLGAIANQSETDVTVKNLLYLQSMVATATTAYSLAYAVKLKAVRIWFTALTAGTAVSATIEWNAAATGFLVKGTSVSETNVSTTEVVLLEAFPPKSSLSSWYQGGPTVGSNSLFSFSAPADSTIELEFDWVPCSTENNPNTSIAIAANTVGNFVCVGINANVLALPPLNSAF